MDIENKVFSDAWISELFTMEMEHDAYVCVDKDADPADELVGYICAWQVMDECTITNIAVQPDLQGKGIAKFMFGRLRAEMDKRLIRYYYLEVRASNTRAKGLYEKMGFTTVGIRKGYYHDPVEDAVVMSLDLTAANQDTSI